MKLKPIFLYAALLALMLSCAQENPNLVNPPVQYTTVRVRLLNYAGDQKARLMTLDSKSKTAEVPYAKTSAAIVPPADSSVATLLLGGELSYRRPNKIKFVRKTFCTVVALPSMPNDSIQDVVDTMLVTNTNSDLQIKPNTANIKFMNLNRDSSANYTFTLGCPNGTAFAQNQRFGMVSMQYEIRSQGISVSVTRSKLFVNEVIGLFTLNLTTGGQYIAYVDDDSYQNKNLKLLNETDPTENALTTIPKEQNFTTYFRTVNLSRAAVNIEKRLDSLNLTEIETNLPAMQAGSYKSIDACRLTSSDVFYTSVNSSTISSVMGSLQVNEKYTLLVFDSAANTAALPILLNPYRMSEPTNGRALVRVVNGAYNNGALTISIGARTDPSGKKPYFTGELIAKSLNYTTESKPVFLPAGVTLPLTVFTATEPAKLLYCNITQLQPDKSYTMSVFTDDAGNDQLVLIEDNDENINVIPLQKGMFTQFVNLYPFAANVPVAVPTVLANAPLNYTYMLATVLPLGSQNVQMNGQSVPITADKDARGLIIATGTKDSPDFLSYQYTSQSATGDGYSRRFINACKGLDNMKVKINSATEAPVAENILYGLASDFQKIVLDRKTSILFIDAATDATLYQINDIYLPFGKNYTFILGGDYSTKNFSAVVLQEY